MTNRIVLLVFIVLVTLNNVFASGDAKVFQALHNDKQIACAAIDEERAFCWDSTQGEFLTLQVDPSKRQSLPPIDEECNVSPYHCGSLTDLNTFISEQDLNLYVSKLKELTYQMFDYNKYDSEYSENRRAKVRAIGATIYMLYGHTVMVKVCDALPKARGVRRYVESLWDRIGYWLG